MYSQMHTRAYNVYVYADVTSGDYSIYMYVYIYVLMPCTHLNGMSVGVYLVPGEATCSGVDYSNRLAGDTNGLVNSQ